MCDDDKGFFVDPHPLCNERTSYALLDHMAKKEAEIQETVMRMNKDDDFEAMEYERKERIDMLCMYIKYLVHATWVMRISDFNKQLKEAHRMAQTNEDDLVKQLQKMFCDEVCVLSVFCFCYVFTYWCVCVVLCRG